MRRSPLPNPSKPKKQKPLRGGGDLSDHEEEEEELLSSKPWTEEEIFKMHLPQAREAMEQILDGIHKIALLNDAMADLAQQNGIKPSDALKFPLKDDDDDDHDESYHDVNVGTLNRFLAVHSRASSPDPGLHSSIQREASLTRHDGGYVSQWTPEIDSQTLPKNKASPAGSISPSYRPRKASTPFSPSYHPTSPSYNPTSPSWKPNSHYD